MIQRAQSFNVQNYLQTPEDIAEYLTAALEGGDVSDVAACLGTVARSRGMAVVAADAGLGCESLYKALSAGGNPQLRTVLGVVRATGFRLQVVPAKD